MPREDHHPRGGKGLLDREHTWTINDVMGADLGSGLRLKAMMRYTIGRTSATAQPFKVTTRTYMYAVEAGDGEVASAHWHPNCSSPVEFPTGTSGAPL